MNRLTWTTAVASFVLFAAICAGCGKKADAGASAADSNAQKPAGQAEAGSVSTANIAGAKDVMAALDKKDYDGAVAELVRISQSVSTADQQAQFSTLAGEVRVKLLDAGPSDPKVSQALSVLRRITGGR